MLSGRVLLYDVYQGKAIFSKLQSHRFRQKIAITDVLWHSFCPPSNLTLFLGSFLPFIFFNLLIELLQIMPLVRYSTHRFHIT